YVDINVGGDLGTLRAVARRLVKQHPTWSEADAVNFVLTDQVPPPLSARIVSRQSLRWPAASLLIMTVSPPVRPRDLAKLYSDARDEMLPETPRQRAPSALKIEAALFADERNDGRTWSSVLDEWNAARPDRPYGHWRQFARDCRHGYRAI